MFVAENVLKERERESRERQTTSCDVPTQCMNKQLQIATDKIFFYRKNIRVRTSFLSLSSFPYFFVLLSITTTNRDDNHRMKDSIITSQSRIYIYIYEGTRCLVLYLIDSFVFSIKLSWMGTRVSPLFIETSLLFRYNVFLLLYLCTL